MSLVADDSAGIAHPFATFPGEGAAIEIAPGVLWLRMPLPWGLDHVNCYAIDDHDGWTIVDTGIDSRRSRALWQDAMAGPLGGRPVRRVLVTHYHPDHIGLAGWFQAQGAELLTTRTSWLFARMLILDEHPLPATQTLAFWRGAGMDAAFLARRAAERPFNFCDVVAPLPLGYIRLKEGDRLTLGGRDWIVRTGDGHAPEHACLFSQTDNLVIGGDQLLPQISANLGVYASEPDADPVAEWIDSARRFQPLARPDHLVLPGHKLPFTGLPLRLSQMIANHEGALDRLADFLSEPRTAVDCFATLYKRAIGEAEFGLALVEAVAHLNHLLKAGRIQRHLTDEGVWLWRRAY